MIENRFMLTWCTCKYLSMKTQNRKQKVGKKSFLRRKLCGYGEGKRVGGFGVKVCFQVKAGDSKKKIERTRGLEEFFEVAGMKELVIDILILFPFIPPHTKFLKPFREDRVWQISEEWVGLLIFHSWDRCYSITCLRLSAIQAVLEGI